MGPLISDRAARSARTAAASLPGQVLLAAGTVLDRAESFISPSLVDVTGHDVADEEIFAPVLQVRKVASLDEAIQAANATRFGLAAGVISDDVVVWNRVLSQSRAGVVNWNRPTTGAAGSMPFGGLGASGNHRPSAYYAADYCAYPIASFESQQVHSSLKDIKGLIS
jgi:succinylglutamic semialdehyde dehydrogenase